MKQVQKGFTLIELMIVVAIIGILAAVAIPAYQDYITKAKVSKVASAVASVQTAIASYAQENGGQAALTGVTPTWTSLGLDAAGATTTTEVTSISVGSGGVITAAMAAAVAGSACNITFTPAVGETALKWTVATNCASTTPVPAIIAKWN